MAASAGGYIRGVSARPIVGLLAALALIVGCGSAEPTTAEPTMTTTDAAAEDLCFERAVSGQEAAMRWESAFEGYLERVAGANFNGAGREYGHMREANDDLRATLRQIERDCGSLPGYSELTARAIEIEANMRQVRQACRDAKSEIDLIRWDC